MYDIHCHLIYGVDDGAVDINKSIELIKSAKENGYKGLVLTPHYIENSKYNSNVSNNNNIIEMIKKNLLEKNIDIEIYLGNEVYFAHNILELIEKKEITTLNNSKYLLMELSVHEQDKNVMDVIDYLNKAGIIPIIAHPERYDYLVNNLNLMGEFIDRGALFQINLNSLIGMHGRKQEKITKDLIKNNLVHFISSDTHEFDNYMYISKAIRILKEINPSMVDRLLNDNPHKVIKNIPITIEKTKIKRGIFR